MCVALVIKQGTHCYLKIIPRKLLFWSFLTTRACGKRAGLFSNLGLGLSVFMWLYLVIIHVGPGTSLQLQCCSVLQVLTLERMVTVDLMNCLTLHRRGECALHSVLYSVCHFVHAY